MSDHDRGAYTPPSERLSFDPREPVRSGGPAPVTLIISGIVLVAIIGAVFLLYRGGVRHKGEGPVVVGAPVAEIKSAPPPAANSAPASLSVSKVDAQAMAGNTAPAFAPSPEQPLPRPLPEKVQPVTSTPLPPPVASTPPPPATVKPTPVAAKPPPVAKPPAKPITIASLANAAVAQKPAVKAAPKPTVLIMSRPPVAPVAAAALPPGAGWVQIGAYSSSALAEKGWSDVAQLAPAAMTGKGRKVEPVLKDGKTLYRAYVTGFAGRDAARAFCDKLRAGGKACFVK
jgi:hypothetical protein